MNHVQYIISKETSQGNVTLVDGGYEWRIRLPDGKIKGICTKHISIDAVKDYFLRMTDKQIFTE